MALSLSGEVIAIMALAIVVVAAVVAVLDVVWVDVGGWMRDQLGVAG